LTVVAGTQVPNPSDHLAAIVESSEDAIISKDLNGIIQTWNKAAERLFGYAAHEIIGKPVLTLIPEDRHHEEDRILGQIRRGERIQHFETVRQRKDGSLIDISLTVSPIKDNAGNIVGASKIARDIREKKHAEGARELLLHEIKHRVKNTLGTVQAIVRQTFRSANPEEHKAFFARLNALSEAHDLLTQSNWEAVTTVEVVDRALRPFLNEREAQIKTSGPTLQLSSNKALLIAMLLHELGTNAVKYGALSTTSGVVELTWKEVGPAAMLEVLWRETGGPLVVPPTHKGFGSLLIERAVAADKGSAKLEFKASGLTCSISLPGSTNNTQ
jgi:PAS domain S-box-containing protein